MVMLTRIALARILSSTLFGGLFYSAWLSGYLLLSPDGDLFEAVFWISAPLLTATGFASGLIVADLIAKRDRKPFLKELSWPLLGCIIGAVAVFWFGPMLIVFSMLALGTISVVAREIVLAR